MHGVEHGHDPPQVPERPFIAPPLRVHVAALLLRMRENARELKRTMDGVHDYLDQDESTTEAERLAIELQWQRLLKVLKR